MSLNKFQFIGHLTRDPELTYTPGGKAVANIDIAVNDVWTDSQGQKQEKVNYFRIKTWEKKAENAGKYLAKGSMIFVEGAIQNNTYEKEGQTVYGFEFVADSIEYLSKKKGGDDSSGQ
jgi:single-strand DNA-binding protein